MANINRERATYYGTALAAALIASTPGHSASSETFVNGINCTTGIMRMSSGENIQYGLQATTPAIKKALEIQSGPLAGTIIVGNGITEELFVRSPDNVTTVFDYRKQPDGYPDIITPTFQVLGEKPISAVQPGCTDIANLNRNKFERPKNTTLVDLRKPKDARIATTQGVGDVAPTRNVGATTRR